MAFKDHFSGHAAAYAQARPTYPRELFQWLADQCLHHDLAWDVGCGNGQASLALAHHFERVHASDPSAEQIAAAPQDPRIHWRVEPAEHCSLHNHTVDLVTVAQAYHWFDAHRFCSEAQRVMRPGAVIARAMGTERPEYSLDDVVLQAFEVGEAEVTVRIPARAAASAPARKVRVAVRDGVVRVTGDDAPDGGWRAEAYSGGALVAEARR